MGQHCARNVDPLRAVVHLVAHQPQRMKLVTRAMDKRHRQGRQRIADHDAANDAEA
jgi:hypothetical protein